MVVSDFSVIIFTLTLIIIALFCRWCYHRRPLRLLHKLYLALALCYGSWLVPLMIMHFVDVSNTQAMFILDCFTTPGGLNTAPLYLCIALTFVKDWEKLPKACGLLFVLPTIGVVVAFTNPLHHLQYIEFSVIKDEIVFGPFVNVTGLYSYFCLLVGMTMMIRFAWKNKSRLYMAQSILFFVSGIFPLIVSAFATFSNIEMSIAATPLSFTVPIVAHGYAIFKMHFLDIKPIATQRIMDWISDCYMVLNNEGLVITYNRRFASLFASKYGIAENRFLKDCAKEEDIFKKTAIFNMITAVQSCEESLSMVSYEQAMTVQDGEKTKKLYYIGEVSPLIIDRKNRGFVVIYKDITKMRESMRQLEDSKRRMMEQERLAFLGQMIGGLAHNLKTPIMSISGCLNIQDDLVVECEEGLDDSLVTKDDFIEIYGEMKEWNQKMRDSLTYMNEIISAIKGQATTAATEQNSLFALEEALNRCKLLLRHELLEFQCTLNINVENNINYEILGDINNLVQVLNNLISNAIDAQHQAGGGEISVRVYPEGEFLQLTVVDHGYGVPAHIKEKLFKAMVTSKGAKGTGLGLYISTAIIRGKFDGNMWMCDNENGGSTFGISIPMERVSVPNL